jgi:predicted acylesterase/phospholipase RssA
VGCLRAIEALLDRSLLDMDIYVGISGGAFVTSLLACGVSPSEMYEEVTNPSGRPLGASARPIFRVGAREYLRRSLRAPSVLAHAVATALAGEGRNASDLAFSLLELLPPGLLDNSGIQEYLQRVFRSRGGDDRFDSLTRELYVVAVDLDTGAEVVFGDERHRQVPISQAVQASTALPGFYRPVRIGDRDFVDGGVTKTAHIDLAIRNGAELVICINPIVPILNDRGDGPLGGPLSRKGVGYVMDQVFRIMLHGRMQYGLRRYQAEYPNVDILLVEPLRDDMCMFSYNIMRYSARKVVAQHGYRSALGGFRDNLRQYRRVLKRHGIGLRDPQGLPPLPPVHPCRTAVGRRLASHLDLLDSKLG